MGWHVCLCSYMHMCMHLVWAGWGVAHMDARHRITLRGVNECEGMASWDTWGHPRGNAGGEARIEKEMR